MKSLAGRLANAMGRTKEKKSARILSSLLPRFPKRKQKGDRARVQEGARYYEPKLASSGTPASDPRNSLEKAWGGINMD